MKDRDKRHTQSTDDRGNQKGQVRHSPGQSVDSRSPSLYHSAAFEAFPFATTLIDTDGTILDLNQPMLTFARSLGLEIEKQDRVGRHVSLFAGSLERQQRLRNFVDSLFENGRSSTLNWSMEEGPEGPIHVIIHGRLLRTSEGAITGAILVREDFTSRERETQRKQVIHRIREQVWSMRASGDIEQLLLAVRQALIDLGLHFNDCAVNLVDSTSSPPRVLFHNMAEDGRWHQDRSESEGGDIISEIWRSKKVAYRSDLTAEDTYGENPYIHDRLGHRIRSVLDAPFSHGTLAINCSEPDAFASEDIDIIREIAEVLGEGFSRLDNFQVLEQRNRELEQEVAARQQAEALLQQSHEGLERQVEERTADLRTTNQILEQEIAERQQAKEHLQRSLDEKEVLLKEIHHRVKNNLQIVSSLIDLQARQASDPQIEQMFRDSRDRIRSMALLHEKLYQSIDLTHIDLPDYIQILSGELFHSYGAMPDLISLEVQVDEISLGINEAIACGLIINELVSNALKHAFPEGRSGKICISLHVSNSDKLCLMVSDDGVGLPANLDLPHTQSLGLKLVASLTNQLKGELEFSTTTGANFRVTFPAPKSDSPD